MPANILMFCHIQILKQLAAQWWLLLVNVPLKVCCLFPCMKIIVAGNLLTVLLTFQDTIADYILVVIGAYW